MGIKCEAGPCPIHGLLELLARPWTLHIIWALGTDGPSRFGVLRRRVGGISSRVLTERLRVLEQKGFVYRHYEATIPPAVTYGLTKRVNDVQRVLKGLNQLAQQWQEEDAPAPAEATGSKSIVRGRKSTKSQPAA